MKRIYLDNNATTLLAPEVLEAMLLDLAAGPGNPSSLHFFGQEARKKLLSARTTIASYFKIKPAEIVFTSGGTEGINMLLRGHVEKNPKGHIITSNVEHSCVYNTLKALEKKGVDVTYLKVGPYGAVKPEAVKEAITGHTGLIILGAVNNETGVKTDLEAIAKIAHAANIPFVVDGVALLGKETFSIPAGVSAMAFSGHKIHAPKGSGFVFLRSSYKIAPLITGGDQEFAKRAGTENLSGILGLAQAIELLKKNTSAMGKIKILRDRFEKKLKENLGEIVINGTGPRIGNTSNISFTGIDGETLLIQLDKAGIAASHGSACASGALEPSRILLNMQIPKSQVKSSVRFTLSRFTTEEEIGDAVHIITELVKTLRTWI